ncbi:MAG: efflux RND transporter periplasmic adaptor subunit [Verrucomicrobiota bacterium]
MKVSLSLILVFFGVQFLFSAEEEKSSVPVETVTAVRSESILNEIRLTGTVVSRRFSGLSSRADGLVEEVMVDAGSQVKKGDVLLTLDSRFAEIELDLIRSEIEVARVQLRDAERKQDEVSRLTESGAFAKSEAASLDAAAEIRAAELKRLEVREVQQLERIERHRLVAPFDGSVTRKATEAGEWVETGTTVFDLVETKVLWFELQVAQELLAAIQNVEEATVVLDPFQETPLSAEIDVIVPVKDPVSRTFLTRLAFDDPKSMASPGMSGTAVLKVRPARATSVSIPRDAVTRYPDGTAKVWTIREEGGRQIARSVSVKTTGSLGETVEVTEGLQGGEQVVVRGNEGLSDEDEVEATGRSTGTGRDSL